MNPLSSVIQHIARKLAVLLVIQMSHHVIYFRGICSNFFWVCLSFITMFSLIEQGNNSTPYPVKPLGLASLLLL